MESERRTCASCGAVCDPRMGLCGVQHRLTGIEADDVRAVTPEGEGRVPRAAPDVQARLEGFPGMDHAFEDPGVERWPERGVMVGCEGVVSFGHEREGARSGACMPARKRSCLCVTGQASGGSMGRHGISGRIIDEAGADRDDVAGAERGAGGGVLREAGVRGGASE